MLARDPYVILKGVGISSLETIEDKDQAVQGDLTFRLTCHCNLCSFVRIALAVIHSLSRQNERPLLHCEKSEGDLTRTLTALTKCGAQPELALAALANVLVEEGVTVSNIIPFLRNYVVGAEAAVTKQLVRCLANLSADGISPKFSFAHVMTHLDTL